jgi:hypothetical protein
MDTQPIKPINVFYHVFLRNDWKSLVKEQLVIIIKSGLYDECKLLNIGVISTEEDYNDLKQLVANIIYDNKKMFKVEYRHTTENTYEFITLNWVKEMCDKEDCYVFYHHTKGVSILPDNPEYLSKVDWRKCMTYFNVERWREMVENLISGVDICGIIYRRGFFWGNFWWSNSNWIKNLPDVKKCNIRSRFERWIVKHKEKALPKTYVPYSTRDFGILKLHAPKKYRKDL